MLSSFRMRDGSIVGTGLLIPATTASFAPDLPVTLRMPMNDILDIAKRRNRNSGVGKFDSSWIRNQGSYGSCQGFASAWALGRARVRRGLDRVNLSGAYLYSLVNGGRDVGSTLDSGMEAITRYGVALESTVPVNGVFRNRYNTSVADAEAARFKGFECYAVRSELDLFSALALGFDCIVAVHADNGFNSLDGRGVARGGSGPGNHAVGADELWFDGELIASGVNSWGLSYGDQGRMGLTWKQHFQHTTRYHPFYAIRSTLDDPSGTNPPVAAG
jgi:hypothetical protein